ncbi:NAD(+) diphosphatase, partial [Dietzia sp. B19]
LRVDRRNRFATDPAAGGRRRIRLEPASDHAEELPETAVFLGRTDEGRHIWALPVEELPDDPAVASLRVTGADLVEGDGSLASQALALLGWHRDTVRGREPQHHPRRVDAGWAIEDPFHGGPEYPRTDPAVICLVHDGGRRVLLARQPVWPAGMYSHVAGFVEAGESLEGCVRREVKEEVGVEVDRVRYLGSQPWPFPRSLMVGFHAVGDPDAPIVLEDEEISEAAWFDVDEVRAALDGRGDLMVAPPVSIAHVMLRSWVAAVDR